MPENCAVIIDRLIEQRHNKRMTQKEVAKAACLTQSVIARLESKKATPQLDTLLKVAAALDCSLEIVPIETDLTDDERESMTKGRDEYKKSDFISLDSI